MQRASRDYRKWVLLIETTTEQHQILKSDQWEITELRLSGWQETRIRRGGGQQQVTGDGRCCRGLSSSLWWQGQLQLQRWELRWGHAAQEAILAQSAWAGGDAPAPQPSWEDQTLQYAWQTQLLLPWGRKSDLFSSLPESPWFTQHRHVPRSPTVSAECWAAAAETSTQWTPARTPQPPKCSTRHIQRGSGEHCFAQQKHHSQCMVLMGPLVFLEPCLFLRLLMGLFWKQPRTVQGTPSNWCAAHIQSALTNGM